MSSPAITPQSPTPGGSGSGGAAPPTGGPGMAIFARISQMAQQMAEQFPESAPMAREIQNQVRMATMKSIQAQAPQPQQTPQI